MKKLVVLVLFSIFVSPFYCTYAQGDAEKVAEEIIKAYKTEDVALLKKYVTGMMLYVINDGFFQSDDGKPLVEVAKNWDGTIKEIRYSEGDMMGKKVLLASVYFSDNPNGNLNVVTLTSYEKSDWKAFALGISDISKEEFEQGSKEIPGTNQDASKQTVDRSEFSIEMANGDTFEKPENSKLEELLRSLNDDNFFLILNSKDGFLQASTSEQGYIVQYSDDSGMFEAEDYFTLDQLIDIFTTYIEKGNWKEKASKWLDM